MNQQPDGRNQLRPYNFVTFMRFAVNQKNWVSALCASTHPTKLVEIQDFVDAAKMYALAAMEIRGTMS